MQKRITLLAALLAAFLLTTSTLAQGRFDEPGGRYWWVMAGNNKVLTSNAIFPHQKWNSTVESDLTWKTAEEWGFGYAQAWNEQQYTAALTIINPSAKVGCDKSNRCYLAGCYGGTTKNRLLVTVGKPGRDGRDGVDGRNGVDGKNGNDGKDGTNGVNGADGKNGSDGRDAVLKEDSCGRWWWLPGSPIYRPKCGKAWFVQAAWGGAAYGFYRLFTRNDGGSSVYTDKRDIVFGSSGGSVVGNSGVGIRVGQVGSNGQQPVEITRPGVPTVLRTTCPPGGCPVYGGTAPLNDKDVRVDTSKVTVTQSKCVDKNGKPCANATAY